MDQTFRVVLTGGGSGGHIYPLLAVADAIEQKSAEMGFACEMSYFGARDSYAPLFTERDIKIVNILGGKFRRYFSIENFLDVPKLVLGFFEALWKLYFLMPDVIFSKGGTGAFPVVLAAWFYQIPIAIHESDAIPGLTNSWSGQLAKKIFVSFAAAAAKFEASKVTVTGAPIRGELLEHRTSPELAKEALGFVASKPLILVIGGSQGSVRINNFILANLALILKEAQVLHQTGVANFLEAQKLSHAALIDEKPENRYLPVNYFTDNLATAYMAADVVVGRPGGTVFEIASFGKPAILIPIAESANDHQKANAYAFADAGAGIVIEEANLLPGIFVGQLKKILSDAGLREKMAAASANFYKPNAAETIAEELIKLAT